MNPAQGILVAVVRLYQWTLSPLKTAVFGPAGRCRFHLSCSAYAVEALRRHGACRGAWLTLQRLLRCHPWGECGSDPVPEPDLRHTPTPSRPLPAACSTPPKHPSPAAGCRH